MKIMSSGEARDIRNKNINFAPFGKCWQPGDTLRVYYPLIALEEGAENTTRDIPVAAGFFFKTDGKERLSVLKRFAIPTKYLDAVDKKDPRVTEELPYKMVSVARTLHDAALEKLDNEITKKVQDKPESTKAITDAAAKKRKNLEDAGPAIIGPRYEMYIEAVAVPIDPKTLEIKTDGIMCVRQSLSEKRRQALLSCANDISTGVKVVDSYVEITYNFPTGERNLAGQTLPSLVAPDYRLATVHPTIFETDIKPKLELLTQDSDVMINRNTDFIPYDEQALLSAFSAYLIDAEDLLEEYHEHEKFSSRFRQSKELLTKFNMEKYVSTVVAKEAEKPGDGDETVEADNEEGSEGETSYLENEENGAGASEIPSPSDIISGKV